MVRQFAWMCFGLALALVGKVDADAAPLAGTGTPSATLDVDGVDPDKGFFAQALVATPATINQLLSATPLEVDVMFANSTKLHVVDSDAGDFGGMESGFEDLGMEIDVANNSGQSGALELTLDFLDEVGNVITPAALAGDTFGTRISFTIDGYSGMIGFGRLFRAELMNGLTFAGMRVGLTGDSQLLWKSLGWIEIRKVDATTSVVPEPTTDILAVVLIGVAALGVRRMGRGRGCAE